MTARIDVTETATSTSVRIAGRLDESAARDLLELCRHRTERVSVDVQDLISIERGSVGVLQDLRAAGARILGATPYIEMLLNAGADGPLGARHAEEEDE